MTPELRAKLSANLEKARAAKKKRAKAPGAPPSLATQLYREADALVAGTRRTLLRAKALRRAARIIERS
jgi:hypothetical protein